MAILTTVASALTLLAPQNPASPAPANPFLHAAAFPQETKLLLSWNGTAASPWTRIIGALPADLQRRVPFIVESAARAVGISPEELEGLGRARVSFGVIDFSTLESVEWLAVADFDAETQTAMDAIRRLAGNTNPTASVWTLRTDLGLAIAIGRFENLLLFGSSRAPIESALARLEDVPDHTPSITDSIRFQRFLAQCGDERSSRSSFSAAYLDVTAALDAVATLAPSKRRTQIENVLDALQIRQIYAIGHVAHEVDGRVHELARVCFPKPRKGFPALLATTSGQVDRELARFVPVGAPSMSIFHLDTSNLLDEVMVFASAFDATVAQQIRAGVVSFGQRMNIDVESELLGSLGSRMMLVQWPSDEAFDGALVASLRDPLTFADALARTRQFETSVAGAFQLYRHRSGLISIAVGEGNIVASQSETRLQEVLAHAASDSTDPEITSVLDQATSATTAASWTDAERMVGGYFDLLDRFAPPNTLPPGVRRYVPELLASFGTMTSIVSVDSEGISSRTDSRLGTLGMAATVALAAATAAAGELDPSLATDVPARRAAFSWRLGEIANAMISTGTRELDVVADTNPEILGESIGGGQFRVDGYRIAVMSDPRDSESFAVVAWPDDQQRGDVFACTENCVPLVNDVLTQTTGVERLTARDLFLGGDFRGTIAPGWSPVRLAAADAVGAEFELTGHAWARYQSIVAAEEGHLELESQLLIDYLSSDDLVVAGRAAHAIAALRLQDAVPTLCERMGSIEDPGVRRQFAQAIVDLADPRSLATVRALLSDSDSMVRTLAAGAAGAQADRGAVEGLLDLVAREVATGDGSDRTQALLSLADIGDPSCLKEIAGLRVDGEQQQQALAYLFQELSPKLGAEEATTLMAVLDHHAPILRRYAIQRLGELRDPRSANALENRLASEGDALRPLVEVSLSAVRGTEPTTEEPSEFDPEALVAAASEWLRGLDRQTRQIVIAGSAGVAMLFFGLIFVALRRGRRRRRAVDWAEMTEPSEGFVSEEAEYADDPFWSGVEDGPDRLGDSPMQVDLPSDEQNDLDFDLADNELERFSNER